MNFTYDDIRKNAIIFTGDNRSTILIYKYWRFFYTIDGDTAPLNAEDTSNSGIPDYVELMLYKFETALILLSESFGLRNPLNGGFFYDQGVEYIDIFIKNIPREHGIASGIVYNEEFELLNDTSFQGKSLKITIHRNLIQKTATPIHELFHIFQYSYTHFNNMWFMEGLARWSQSIMQAKTGTQELLPQTYDELDVLVHKLHDAEFFFNHLITLCEEKYTFEIPAYLDNNSEIYNNKKTGSIFMKVFLENCESQYKFMQKDLKSRDIKDKLYWARDDKRSANNNQYIFKAIIDTVNTVCKDKNEELTNFIDLIYPLAYIQMENFKKDEIQAFLKVIQKLDKKFVLVSDESILYSEFFDIFTGTFSSKKLDFTDSDLSDDNLDTFKILKRLNGSLILKNCKKLTHLNGLRNLQTIDGDLILTGTYLVKLNELNNLISVSKLHISFMDNLTSISGLNELVRIKSSLLISNNKNLTSIKGFNSLAYAGNIEIIKTKLHSCAFLSPIFKENSTFNGHIKMYNNQLENVDFMSGIEHIKSSLFLHQNQLTNLIGLENLKSVGASVSLSANKIVSLKALSNLETINGLLALSYNKLKSLDGLGNLKYLVTKKWGSVYFTIKFYGNKELVNISALKNVGTKDDHIVLYYDSEINYIHTPSATSRFHENILELHDYKTNALIPTYRFIKKETHNYKNFRKTTHNKLLNTLFDFEVEDAEVLVLSFTGAYGNLGGLFYNKYPLITENIVTHKIFMMDPTHTWYNKGVSPFTTNMDENIAFIKELIRSKKYKKVVCMGASMGAYFSLLLGCCLEDEIDEVLAFSPQIFMDKKNRKRIGDKRWSSLISNFPTDIKEEYFDLKLLFQKFQNKTTKFNIHYAKKELLDNEHISHLIKQDNIKLVAYDVDDHYITIMLHNQKRLSAILIKSLQEIS